jgi:anti-sigma-K factor RskA
VRAHDQHDQQDQHEGVGAYVVGALEPADAAAFETHLLHCGACRAEVVALREVAAELSFLAAAPPPPPGLRTAVLAAIPEVPQLPPVAAPAASTALEDAPVDLAAARRTRLERRTRVLTLLVAAVSVLALALGGVVVSLAGRDQAPVASAGADAGLLAAPDARIVRATLADGTEASFVVSKSQNRALFAAHALPDPGAGRTYQLWTLRGGTPSPDSTLGGGADVTQWFHGPVAEADQLAVTVEPAGGSRTPTLPILASGTV